MDTSQLLGRAQAFHGAGRLDEAASAYREALHDDPDNGDASYGLGTVLMQEGELESAVELMERAVASDPDVPEYHFNLALVREKLGQGDLARASLLRAAGLAGVGPELIVPICRKLLDFGLARECYQRLEGAGAAPEVLMLRAKAQGELGDWAGARDTLQQAKAAAAPTPALWRQLSTAAAHLRDYDSALAHYASYLACVDRPTADDHLAHADLHLMARQADAARRALDAAFALGAERAEAYQLAARCARLAGDYDRAHRDLRRAIELRPAYGDAWLLLLEMLGEDALEDAALRCRELAEAGAGTEWDQITLPLAAGQAFDRLERFQDAFAAFELGNARHKAMLAASGSAYDPAESEASIEHVMQLFPALVTNVSPHLEGPPPLFIVGMPRSGTTLVERIVTGLDGVRAGGENEALEFVASQYYWDMEHRRRAAPRELDPAEWSRLAADYRRRTRVEAPGEILTDKMPHNFRHVGLIWAMFPTAPIITLRRDPRDVCLSIYSRRFPDGHRYACDLEALAHFYGQFDRLIRHWKALNPNGILEVCYEELVARPTEKTREIAAFAGLAWRPECLDFHGRTEESFTFSELQVRRPLSGASIGRWRHYQAELAPLLLALAGLGTA